MITLGMWVTNGSVERRLDQLFVDLEELLRG
jgi:hypothetical protein